MINMHGKVSLIVLVLFVIVRAEEISSDTKVDTKFLDSSLSTAVPHLSYNDQHLTKSDQRKALLSLMPDERENKTAHKTKRCSKSSQREKLSSTEENLARTDPKSFDKNISVGAPEDDYLNAYKLARSRKDTQGNPARSDKNVDTEPRKKRKILLQTAKNDGNDVIADSQPRENAKRCNVGKCICYCQDENCCPTSSRKSSPQMMLGSSREDKPARMNNRLPKYESRLLDILQRKPSRLHHENLYESRVPNLINPLPIKSYRERLSDIPAIYNRYAMIPDDLPSYMLGKAVDVGVPFASFERRPNFLVGGNAHPQYRSFIRHNPPMIERSQEAGKEQLDATPTSSSMSYIDTATETVTKTASILGSYEPTGIAEKAEETFESTEIPNNYAGELIDAETENNPSTDYSTDVIEEDNTIDFTSSDEMLHKSEDSTETTEAAEENDLAGITSILTDYTSGSGESSVIYSPITHDGKLISMEECMKLFGHDVCVLGALTSPRANPSMLSSEESNTDPNEEDPKPTSTELNIVDKTSPSELSQYVDSVVQAYEPRVESDKDESSGLAEDIPIPTKKLGKSQAIDKTVKTVRNKLLGKSKSHEVNLSLNSDGKRTTNLVSNEKSLQERPKEETANFNIDSDEEDRQSTTMQDVDYEESNESSDKDDGFDTITGLSTRNLSKDLPFCSNALLLNSIRKIINDFTLDTRVSRTETGEDVSQQQGENFLPEILEVPHLKSILSIPRIEDMIVERVKNVLSDVAAVPRKDLANDWSPGIIRSTLRGILEDIPGSLQLKLPPMTVQEHQLRNGQWVNHSVTLTPLADNKSQKTRLKKLQEDIRDLLSFSVIASQADQHVMRNVIVQSMSHSLINDEGNEETDDSIIYDVLDDILRMSKAPEDANALGENDVFVNNDKSVETTASRGTPTGLYETENADASILDKEKLGAAEETRINDNEMPIATATQKARSLKNHVTTAVTSESPNLSETYDKDESIQREMPNKAVDVIRENARDPILDGITKTDAQDEGSEFAEPSKSMTTYEKAILQNDPNTLKASVEANLKDKLNSEEDDEKISSSGAIASAISSITAEDLYEKLGENEIDPRTINDIDESSRNDLSSNDRILENTEDHRVGDGIVTSVHFTQATSPDHVQVSDDAVFPNVARAENLDGEVKYSLNGERTAAPPGNLISSANEKHGSELITNSPAEEIDPAIILARLEYNSPPIKYYSAESLKYAHNHHAEDKNEIATSADPAVQEISPLTDLTPHPSDLRGQVYVSDSVIARNPAEAGESAMLQYGNHESQNPSPSADEDALGSQQRNLATKDGVAKIHEVTTEIQRTYAKTTYFKPRPSPAGSSGISLFPSSPEAIDDATSGNNNKEANEAIISFSVESSLDDKQSLLQLSPSSTTSDYITELERSRLYYVSDDVKLPLEIMKLKDGSYALSISENACEIILMKRCPCCVPLQGRIVRSSRGRHQEDVNADEEDYWPADQSFDINSVTTTENALTTRKPDEEKEEEEEEEINARRLWKRNLNKNLTRSMQVIDFARKYNLLLDFDKKDVLFNGMGSERRKVGQFRRIGGSELNKAEIKNHMQDMNSEMLEDGYSDEEMMGYGKEIDNSVLQNVNYLNKKEKREHKESELTDREGVSRINVFRKNNARPYRYERNTSDANGWTKVVKSILYWCKSLFEINE